MTRSPFAPPLRVAVIGLGWAGQQHIAGYAAQPDAELVAIAGMETDLLGELGDRYGVPHRFTRWEDVLEIDALDAISIATPPFLHEPVAIAALERGLHVLSEKPIARNGEEADRMVAAAQRAGRVLEVAFNHRKRGDMLHLKQLIDDGRLGDVYYAKAFWLRRDGIPPLGWFTTAALSGGGPLTDVGVHLLDFSLDLMGRPAVKTVSASTWDHFGRARAASSTIEPRPVFDVEDLASVFLRVDGGGTLLVETSWVLHRDRPDEFGVVVYGTKGGAELRVVDYTATGSLRVFTEDHGAPVESHHFPDAGTGHTAVVREFIDAIRGGNWQDHDGRQAAGLSHVIAAAYASSRSGHEVAFHD